MFVATPTYWEGHTPIPGGVQCNIPGAIYSVSSYLRNNQINPMDSLEP